MFLNILLIVLGLGILALSVTIILHIFLPVPYVPTPHKIVERMVELAEFKGDEIVHDLGAGDARLLIAAKRRYPGLTVRGCEVVPTIWFLGKLRSWWSRVPVDLCCGSIERADVRDADVIFLYLIPSLMAKLEKKFDLELREGTRVISSAFTFPTKKEVYSEMVWGKKVFVYEW
ncbi:hypothetical protein HYZ98_02655 [Candidatus Peregrinibacteria bacterium]|nr:hypothetical protein [Candidatus Peregrinibacteria bacterium]